ncbi:hypothetical protein [Serratia fonticola]|uniref:hypothetical protein n=1 Tax=Serratia fonticola TaxID=47917 RepID=UPI003B9F9A0A
MKKPIGRFPSSSAWFCLHFLRPVPGSLYSAPSGISKLIVSVFFSIAVIIVIHKFLCAILKKPPSMDGG